MNKKNIVFIGSGNIVTGYQQNMENCHLKSILNNPSYNVLGVIDPNDKNAGTFIKHSNSKRLNYDDLKYLNIDIIAICSQTRHHKGIIHKIIKSDIKPKCIFCEKPFTETLEDAINSFNSINKLGIGLIVGYQRSFLSNFKKISKEFHDNKYGDFLYADVKYSKGFLNNGSHAIDLLYSIFGKISLDGFGKRFIDYDSNDKSAELHFSYKGRSISLIPFDENSFSIFEIDLIFQKKRFRFIDNSFRLEQYSISNDPNYPGYRSLTPSEYTSTEMTNSIDEMWAEVLNIIDNHNYFDIERTIHIHKLKEKLDKSL